MLQLRVEEAVVGSPSGKKDEGGAIVVVAVPIVNGALWRGVFLVLEGGGLLLGFQAFAHRRMLFGEMVLSAGFAVAVKLTGCLGARAGHIVVGGIRSMIFLEWRGRKWGAKRGCGDAKFAFFALPEDGLMWRFGVILCALSFICSDE